MDCDEKAVMHRCSDVLKGFGSVHVHYEEILELDETYIVVAALEKTSALMHLQRKVVEGMEQWLDRWTHSNIWQPHTTLVHEPGMELGAINRAMQASFVPFDTMIERIEFSRVTENGYEIVGHVLLNK